MIEITEERLKELERKEKDYDKIQEKERLVEFVEEFKEAWAIMICVTPKDHWSSREAVAFSHAYNKYPAAGQKYLKLLPE